MRTNVRVRGVNLKKRRKNQYDGKEKGGERETGRERGGERERGERERIKNRRGWGWIKGQ